MKAETDFSIYQRKHEINITFCNFKVVFLIHFAKV